MKRILHITNKITEAFKKIIICMSVLFSCGINAQDANKSQEIIRWYNNNVTLLGDLGRVNIKTSKGNTIKKARVWEIEKVKGKVTYEKEGCLHDICISEIAYVSPGSNARSLLYFDKRNNPFITSTASIDDLYGEENTSDFKVSYKISEIPAGNNGQTQPESASSGTPLKTTVSDTLVKADGQIVLARIISIGDSLITYKRVDLPDGPVYNINTGPSPRMIKYADSVKITLKN